MESEQTYALNSPIGSPIVERRSTATYEGAIQTMIHALKYEGQRSLSIPLGARLHDTYQRTGWNATLITCVPLHANRNHSRGYNQSALLARRLARLNHSTPAAVFRDDVLIRVRDTRPQVGLNRYDRQQNMIGAFHAESVRGERIVLVDDVYTTGATMRSAAEALRQAGAECVWALTVASAVMDSADAQREAVS
jgi:ComF family protein